MTKNPRKKDRGFTLVEMMVAMLIFSIVSLMIYGIFGNQYKFFLAQQDFSNLTLKMTSGLNIITKDISLTGADPLSAGYFYPQNVNLTAQAFDIKPDPDPTVQWNIANPIREIIIKSDRNGDGALSPGNTNEDIDYIWDSNTQWFRRNSLTLMDHVTDVNFRFFDENGVEMDLATANNNEWLVTLVKIDIAVESTIVDPHTKQLPIRYMSTSIRIINR